MNSVFLSRLHNVKLCNNKHTVQQYYTLCTIPCLEILNNIYHLQVCHFLILLETTISHHLHPHHLHPNPKMLPPPSTHFTPRPVRPHHTRTTSHSDIHYCCTCGGTLLLTHPSPIHPLGRLCCTLCLKAACRKCTISGYILPQMTQASDAFDGYVGIVQLLSEKDKEANKLTFVCCECGWSGLVEPSASHPAASTTRTSKSKSKTTSNQQSRGSRVQRFLSSFTLHTKVKSKQVQSLESAQMTTTFDFSTQTCSMCAHACCSLCIKVQLGGHGGANGDVVALMGGQGEVADLGVLENTNAQPSSNQLPLLDHAGRPIVDIPVPMSSLRPARKSSLRAPMTASYPHLQYRAQAQTKLYNQSRVQQAKHVRFLTPPGSAGPPVTMQETKSFVVERRRADSAVGGEVETRSENKKVEGKGEDEVGVTLYACAYLPAPPPHSSSLHESEGEGMPDSATLPPSVLTFSRHPPSHTKSPAQTPTPTVNNTTKPNPKPKLKPTSHTHTQTPTYTHAPNACLLYTSPSPRD